MKTMILAIILSMLLVGGSVFGGIKVTTLTNQLNELESNYASLQSDYSSLKSKNEALQSEYIALRQQRASLEKDYKEVERKLENALVAPYTTLSGREIKWVWSGLYGEVHEWTLPIDSYRSWIEQSKPHEMLLLSSDGEAYHVEDFTPYVGGEPFAKAVSDLLRFYREQLGQADEMMLAKVLFSLTTQLTVYSEDIGEIARWPVETLTEGGGDCEDLAILFASLLKAAPYNYTVKLVYMDGDNPTNPQTVNHVAVYVEAGDWSAFVETTTNEGWRYYDSVNGWFFEV